MGLAMGLQIGRGRLYVDELVGGERPGYILVDAGVLQAAPARQTEEGGVPHGAGEGKGMESQPVLLGRVPDDRVICIFSV